MSFALTYSNRLLLFLAFCAAVVLCDWLYYGRRASRYREYGFLLFGGICGAPVGLLTDQITSRISPEYFIEGKGLSAGAEFQREVMLLGLKAGFSAGIVAAALLLFSNSTLSSISRLPIAALVWHLLRIGLLACVAAFVVGGIAFFIPKDLALKIIGAAMEPAAAHRFVTVWGIHVGIYLGALIGVASNMVGIFSHRRSLAKATAEPHSDA
jgi:hypothetical protein